jgi:hypothetical protein
MDFDIDIELTEGDSRLISNALHVVQGRIHNVDRTAWSGFGLKALQSLFSFVEYLPIDCIAASASLPSGTDLACIERSTSVFVRLMQVSAIETHVTEMLVSIIDIQQLHADEHQRHASLFCSVVRWLALMALIQPHHLIDSLSFTAIHHLLHVTCKQGLPFATTQSIDTHR